MIRTTVHLTLRRIDPVWPLAAFYFILLLIVCAAVGLTTPRAEADAEAPVDTSNVVYVVATPTAQPAPLLADTLGEKGAPAPEPTPVPQIVYEVVYVPVPVEAPAPQVDTTPEGGSESTSTRGRP